MINSKQYNGRCWWCGKKADSREHKYKKTDIIREFGKGPFQKELLRISGSRIGNGKYVQGPNSNHLKYSSIICSSCNNDNSQQFDFSYTRLMDFLKANEEVIFQTRAFDLFEIFGENWKDEAENVIKYLIKHIGCRLAESNIEVSRDIVNYLNGKGYPQLLTLHLILETKKVELILQMKKDKGWDGILSLTPLTGRCTRDGKQWEYVIGSYNYRAFTFGFSYCYAYTQFECNLISRKVILDLI